MIQAGFSLIAVPAPDETVGAHLRRVLDHFAGGTVIAVQCGGDLTRIHARCVDGDSFFHGIALEGAVLGLTLASLQLGADPAPTVTALSRGPAGHWAGLLWAGYGCAFARLRRPLPLPVDVDPVDGWMAMDGFGFFHGLVRPRRYLVDAKTAPPEVTGFARNVFDHGLGRSLWFSRGAHPPAIAAAIATLGAERADDLWSGVGLACSYPGRVGPDGYSQLRTSAGPHALALATGVAIGTMHRARGGLVPEHTRFACERICQRTPDEVVAIAKDARRWAAEGPKHGGGDYGRFRTRLRAELES